MTTEKRSRVYAADGPAFQMSMQTMVREGKQRSAEQRQEGFLRRRYQDQIAALRKQHPEFNAVDVKLLMWGFFRFGSEAALSVCFSEYEKHMKELFSEGTNRTLKSRLQERFTEMSKTRHRPDRGK